MNVFVLCTGRCRAVTFINACRHITNYSASHESIAGHVGDSRLAYPANHIEADTRLPWLLGRLDKIYGDDAVYVHLKPDVRIAAERLLEEWNSGSGPCHAGTLMTGNPEGMSDEEKRAVCLDYCHSVDANIELFLKDKTKKVSFSLENAKRDFKDFWAMIHAQGDEVKALEEWDIDCATSGEGAVAPRETHAHQGESSFPVAQIPELVQAMSVHQRQMFSKIEDLHAHHEQLYTQQNRIYDQVDALFSIFSLLKIRYPLPTMRGWPVSPDFVKILISQIYERKPNVIVEAGCGVSTLISAYCLEAIGKGHVVSLDHDAHFAGETRKNVGLHQLESQATVLHAPLAPTRVGTETYPWYSFSRESIPATIDLLVVDGPPANMGELVRYPAVPVLFGHLADDAVILVDDAARQGEQTIVERWMNEFGCFEKTFIDTEKGALVLKRIKPS